MIVGRLAEAGVHAWFSRTRAGRAVMAAPCDVYVEDTDLEAARGALAAAANVDEAELTRLAEESGPPPPD
jgi:hypothetical protein